MLIFKIVQETMILFYITDIPEFFILFFWVVILCAWYQETTTRISIKWLPLGRSEATSGPEKNITNDEEKGLFLEKELHPSKGFL